jgi:hypothetical protein
MEHTSDHRVDEEQMHPDYHERETRFRDQAAKLWDKESNVRAMIRTDVSLPEQARMDRYISAYSELENTLDALSSELGREEGAAIQQATELLHGGGSDKQFAAHLTAVSNVPDAGLQPLMNTATRSGQTSLARAVALTAYERGERTIFTSWAESNPERAAALARIKGTPGAEQMATRTRLAMTPPKAALQDLVPTDEDRRKAAEKKAASDTARYTEFFGPAHVRRQAGRRVS